MKNLGPRDMSLLVLVSKLSVNLQFCKAVFIYTCIQNVQKKVIKKQLHYWFTQFPRMKVNGYTFRGSNFALENLTVVKKERLRLYVQVSQSSGQY